MPEQPVVLVAQPHLARLLPALGTDYEVLPLWEESGRARLADRAWQQVAQPELARGEPVVDAGGAEVRAVGRNADVACEREAEPTADRGSVDRRQ